MTTFLSVFFAVLLAEICKMIIDRYIRDRANKTFDKVEAHAKNLVRSNKL